MRPGALLAAVLVLSGCAWIQDLVRPAPPPTLAPAAPATSGPTPSALPRPAPPSPRPPAARTAPRPAPPPPAAVIPDQPPPAPALTPQLGPEEERRFREDTERKLEDTGRRLRQLEDRKLTPEDQEALRLAASFVDQARKALAAREYERAANLAGKARTLADDLAAATAK